MDVGVVTIAYNTGQDFIRMFNSFDCDVIGYDPFVSVEQAASYGIKWMERDDVIRQADILSLHLPATPATKSMMNADVFAMMKDGALLINTARSELIDENALLNALTSKKLAGAALDTFREEPPGKDHPLLQLDEVIATPHTGSHTDSSTNVMGRMALDNCLAVLRGEAPINPVSSQ